MKHVTYMPTAAFGTDKKFTQMGLFTMEAFKGDQTIEGLHGCTANVELGVLSEEMEISVSGEIQNMKG